MTNWSPTTSSPPAETRIASGRFVRWFSHWSGSSSSVCKVCWFSQDSIAVVACPCKRLIEDLPGRATHGLELNRSDDPRLFENRPIVVKRVFEPGIADGEKIERHFR